MSTSAERDRRTPYHGNIFSRDAGAMFIHVRRESGLAHRNLVLPPWQVRIVRLFVSRWTVAVIAFGVASWAYFALQAARVPFLTRRISQMESDAKRLDTLERTLGQLQARYEQVQRMLSGPGASPRSAAGRGSSTITTDSSLKKTPDTRP